MVNISDAFTLSEEIERACYADHVSTLYENSVHTKARTREKFYKPEKFRFRFYSVIDCNSLYMHTIRDNAAANTSTKSNKDRYLSTFPEMRTPVLKIFGLGSGIRTALSLWAVIPAHNSKKSAPPSGVGTSYAATTTQALFLQKTSAT